MTASARLSNSRSPRRASIIHALAGGIVAIGMISAGAFAQPGEKPISRPATPPTAEPAPQPVGQATAPGVTEPRETQIFDDGKAYPVSRFVLKFLYPHPGHPAIEELEKTEVELGQGPDGYVRPRAGIPTVKLRLA